GVAIAIQIGQIVTALAMWPLVFAAGGPIRRPAPLLRTLRRALPFAVTGLVANLQARVAPLMLGSLAPPIELGWFGAASKVGGVARLMPSAIFAGALPVLSHEYERNRDEAHRVARELTRVLLVAAGCGALASLVFARPLLRAVFGSSFGDAAPSLIWIAIGLV